MKNKLISHVEAPFLKKIPANIRPGDQVEAVLRIKEGEKERLQAFEGTVISYRRRGIASSLVLRKHSHGEGVERKVLLHSPLVHSIKRVRRGIVRRAKLYYLRSRTGKSARIKEKFESKS